MNRLTTLMSAAAVAVIGSYAALPTPAAAQAGQMQVDVYGEDPCPNGYICVRHKESERYRLPKDQRLQSSRQQRESWSSKAHALTTVGSTGTGSCSPVGPGGQEGCLLKDIRQTKQAAKEQQEGNTPPE